MAANGQKGSFNDSCESISGKAAEWFFDAYYKRARLFLPKNKSRHVAGFAKIIIVDSFTLHG